MRHQVRADNKQKEDVTVQVTEIVAITISNKKEGNGKGKESRTEAPREGETGKGIAATAASQAAAAAIQTMDPKAPFAATNQTMLLPSGAAAPAASNVESDPAAIVEDAVDGIFVQQVGS
jgi:hypothetical protein